MSEAGESSGSRSIAATAVSALKKAGRRVTRPASPAQRFHSLDLLATLVAVVDEQGCVLFANAALEDALGMSRRSINGTRLQECFTEQSLLDTALQGARGNEFAALRYDAWLRRQAHDPLPVHVVVAQTETAGEVIVELLPLEQQTRQEREERLLDQAQANKELIRNLAHEIKNPLGAFVVLPSCSRWSWEARS
jgi:two-component system, NtrC family, nitrogen regulation sensor histidine kinase GlnL